MKHIIIGMGEIGSALQSILGCDFIDLNETATSSEEYDMMHICIPYTPSFEKIVAGYTDRYAPRYLVIHSTVPVGTSEKLEAVHSPCRGKHPSLRKSLQTFTKYVGGKHAIFVAQELKRHGIPAIAVRSSRDTEAAKLIDLMQLGVMVLLEKEIYSYCEFNDLDYSLVYNEMNQTYNEGYAKLRQPQFTRPIYQHMEGKIGGHCVVQNMPLLDMPSARKILQDDATL